MTRDEYNAKVQEMQRMFLDTRVDAVVANGSNRLYHEGQILASHFRVHWNGHWHTLGTEHFPMSHDVNRQWYDELEYKLRGEFASSLMCS
jgi:hypothetical protein